MILKWLTLVAGLPSMPIRHNQPDAESFLQALFQNTCHVDVSQCEVLAEDQHSVILTISGRCGTPEIGYDWLRTKDVDDSSEDIMLITAHGLPGIHIRWSYSLWKSGYEYVFHHNRLEVAFADARAHEQFIRNWLQTFNIEPHFQESWKNKFDEQKKSWTEFFRPK
jgi:hypothetical protein